MLVQVLFILWSITPLHFLLVYMATLGSQIPLSALMCFIWFGKWGFPDSSAGKESACNARDPGLISGSGRSSGERIDYRLQYSWASLVAQLVKSPPAMQGIWVLSLGWENPLRREQLPTRVFLPGEFHGQRSLAGYTVHGISKSWTRLSNFHFTLRIRMERIW